MPGRGRDVPAIVEHAVAALIRKGVPREKAWKMIVGHFQDIGILKKGTIDLTEKGKRMNAKHLKEPSAVKRAKIALAIGRNND